MPANQESLIERGFVIPSKEGIRYKALLYQYAKPARDDPSQLEESGHSNNVNSKASHNYVYSRFIYW